MPLNPFSTRRTTAILALAIAPCALCCGSTTAGVSASGGHVSTSDVSGGSAGDGGAGVSAGGGVVTSSAGAAGSSVSSGGRQLSGGAGAAGMQGLAGTSAGGAGGAHAGGASSAGGSGGARPTNGCPASPPRDGEACVQLLQPFGCYYDDCSGAGRTRADCVAAQGAGGAAQLHWMVETTPCGALAACEGDGRSNSCMIGQACLVMEGGTISTQCVEHTCGAGPIACDCVKGCYPGCTQLGPTFVCSTCNDPRGCP